MRKARLKEALRKFVALKGELGWVITGQALAGMAALVGVRLLTGLLRPAVYGEFSLGMTLALFVSQCLYGPITNGIARFYNAAAEQGEIYEYLQSSRRLAFGTSGIVALIAMLAVVILLGTHLAPYVQLAISALAFAILTGCNSIIYSIQNSARRRAIVALHQGIESWMRFGFAAVFILVFGAYGSTTILGFAAGSIAILASQIFFMRFHFRNISDSAGGKVWTSKILQYSWPFYAWSLFTWAQYSSDRWALAIFADAKEVGLYAALLQLGSNPIALASTMTLQLFAPIFYRNAGDGDDESRNANVGKLGRHTSAVGLGATALAVLLGAIFHAQIFHVLVAEKYISVSYLLPYMMLASGVFAASQLLELALMSQMRTRVLVSAKIATAVLGVFLNFLGALSYGVNGVVTAAVAISIFYYLWMFTLSTRMARSGSSTSKLGS